MDLELLLVGHAWPCLATGTLSEPFRPNLPPLCHLCFELCAKQTGMLTAVNRHCSAQL